MSYAEIIREINVITTIEYKTEKEQLDAAKKCIELITKIKSAKTVRELKSELFSIKSELIFEEFINNQQGIINFYGKYRERYLGIFFESADKNNNLIYSVIKIKSKLKTQEEILKSFKQFNNQNVANISF